MESKSKKKKKLINTENRLVVARARGLGMGEMGKLFFVSFSLNKLKYARGFKVSGYLQAAFWSSPMVLNLSANMCIEQLLYSQQCESTYVNM